MLGDKSSRGALVWESGMEEENKIYSVNLNIGIEDSNTYINHFQKCYLLEVHQDFLDKKEEKKHNMNSHSQWMKTKIKYNHLPEITDIINKRKIVKVDFGMNIGTEINGVRPAIIYKANSLKYGEDIIVLPMTSYKDGEEKTIDYLDITIENDGKTGLNNKSLVKIRQIRSISKKRIKRNKKTGEIDILGEITDNNTKISINSNILKIFGLDGSE